MYRDNAHHENCGELPSGSFRSRHGSQERKKHAKTQRVYWLIERQRPTAFANEQDGHVWAAHEPILKRSSRLTSHHRHGRPLRTDAHQQATKEVHPRQKTQPQKSAPRRQLHPQALGDVHAAPGAMLWATLLLRKVRQDHDPQKTWHLARGAASRPTGRRHLRPDQRRRTT